jgi:hypothetical protein
MLYREFSQLVLAKENENEKLGDIDIVTEKNES